jgi:Domain of unknown function (DUF1844)
MDEEQGAGRGFRVTDRRRFTEEGESREGQSRPEATPGGAGGAAGAAPPPEASAQGPHAAAGEPAVTFGTFVLGLSTQALVALGEIEHPVSHERESDAAAARQLIDILALLRDKTRGNLQPDEEGLLESVLYDLRMRFVEFVRRSGK